jgi:hypothetical protein
MESVNNCGVCARPLVYGTESIKKTCAICGKEEKTNIYCPEGHYICDTCHSKDAIAILKQVLAESKSIDPAEIIEQVMAHPAVPMHGPEHHAIVPAAIITAVKNTGYPIPEGAIDKAIERASKVPGGWCGLYGDCGAGVGIGIAVSVLTNATPLTGKERGLAIGGTAFGLSKLIDDQPRCCKRSSRRAVEAAVEYLEDKLDIKLTKSRGIQCTYTVRNQQCAKTECPYYPAKINKNLRRQK